MQRMGGSVEEQLVVKCIREECAWENLPKRLQVAVASKEEWHRRVVDYCIRKRLNWNASFARKVAREPDYYDDMMRYLKKNLALFPYHLADYVCRVMRLSPFRYYCDMIFEVMKNGTITTIYCPFFSSSSSSYPHIHISSSFSSYPHDITSSPPEQPYDSIPNFSAADALRLTGIGRNEFIDIMNKCRSKVLPAFPFSSYQIGKYPSPLPFCFCFFLLQITNLTNHFFCSIENHVEA